MNKTGKTKQEPPIKFLKIRENYRQFSRKKPETERFTGADELRHSPVPCDRRQKRILSINPARMDQFLQI
jgi:hypothetical protein